MKKEWKPVPGSGTQDGVLYVGRWCVGSVGWDWMGSKTSEDKIAVYCRLPGFKNRLKNKGSIDEGKKYLEAVVSRWFEGVNE